MFTLLYKNIFKPIAFKFDPEFVHDQITLMGVLLGKFRITRKFTKLLLSYSSKNLVQTVDGVRYSNPVGLSAGFDKNAKLLNILPSVGFGFEEVGSVTLEEYEGNPKPRLYRLKKSKALVVYYGLMNKGVKVISQRIKNALKTDMVIGVSVAKTNCTRTSDEQAGIEDYYECLKYLVDNNIGDYYTINISCPNTFGGEPYTTEDKLEKLLNKLTQIRVNKPIYVKMPINLPIQEFDKLIQVIVKYKINGVIIGNLTKVRDPQLIKDSIPENVKGGISGIPTQELSNNLITHTHRKYGDKLTIIGVGGIFSAADAYEKIKRGATLVQLITGMIFEGPELIKQINSGLDKYLKMDGYTNISEAIGAYNR